jgi:endonuclease YncB( thermonuclease family)
MVPGKLGSARIRFPRRSGAALLGTAAILMALSSPLAAELSEEEETALRLTCGEAQNAIQRICREREMGELVAVPRPAGLAGLPRAERQRLDTKCSKARSYGPAELRRCQAVQLNLGAFATARGSSHDRADAGSDVDLRRMSGHGRETLELDASSSRLAGPALAELQQLLQALGYYHGPVDGRYGRITDGAIQAFEGDRGHRRTGHATVSLLAELRDLKDRKTSTASHAGPSVPSVRPEPATPPASSTAVNQPTPRSAPVRVVPTSSPNEPLMATARADEIAPAVAAVVKGTVVLDGVAIVLDGNTLELAGVPVRLYGIDAPESSQMCVANGRRYQCGRQAMFELADRIGGQPVSCAQQGRDDAGVLVAVCTLGGEQLNAWMVREGWALADPVHPDAYRSEEAAARAERRGMWLGEFASPWEWREHLRVGQTAQGN